MAALGSTRGKILVGYSLGARIALGLAARSAEPFERLVVISGRDGLADEDEARSRRELDDALADTLLHDPVSVAVAPQGATTAAMAYSTLTFTAFAGVLMGRQHDALRRLEKRNFLQAWYLRELFPAGGGERRTPEQK